MDSEEVLKSIESQHGLLVERAKGVYSFSHLTFHEYFTARKIVTASDPTALVENLQTLVNHVTERRWIEVVLLTVGMLPSADYLVKLMKQKIDDLVASDSKIQQFLEWLEKESSNDLAYTGVSIRAVYFAVISDRKLATSFVRARTSSNYRKLLNNLTSNLKLSYDCAFEIHSKFLSGCRVDINYIQSRALQLNSKLDTAISVAQKLKAELIRGLDNNFQDFRTTNLNLANSLDLNSSQIQEIVLAFDGELYRAVQQLREKLPDPQLKSTRFRKWWRDEGQNWIKFLSDVMIGDYNPCSKWQFDEEQRNLLRLYCDTSKLIVDCLKSDCYISSGVRQEIWARLLVPTFSKTGI